MYTSIYRTRAGINKVLLVLSTLFVLATFIAMCEEIRDGFKLWRVDRQERPCLGTTELDASRSERSSIANAALYVRLHAIIDELHGHGIALNRVQVTYNAAHQRSQAFHLKCAIPTEMYTMYLSGCGQHEVRCHVEEHLEKYQERFWKDFYANKLHTIAMTEGHPMGTLLRAKDEDLLRCGPVVSAAVLIDLRQMTAHALDDLMEQFESDVHSIFGHVWFSVCFCFDESENMRIGAKLDETRQFQTSETTNELCMAGFQRSSGRSLGR